MPETQHPEATPALHLSERVRVLEASVPGPSHRDRGVPNQDHCLVTKEGPLNRVIAVADGAGSRQHSHVGSQQAVNAAAAAGAEVLRAGQPHSYADWQVVASRFAEGCVTGFDRAVDLHRADMRGSPERGAFATTLLAVLACPPWYVVVTIGDGFLIGHRPPWGPYLLVAPPLDREHGGVTHFLTSSDRAEHLDWFVLWDPDIRGLAACTDGMIEGLLSIGRGQGDEPQWTVTPDAVLPYFHYASASTSTSPELEQRLESRAFAASSSDDKTLVIATWT